MSVFLFGRSELAPANFEGSDGEWNRDLLPAKLVPRVGIDRVARFVIARVGRHREFDLVNDGRLAVLAHENLRRWLFLHPRRLEGRTEESLFYPMGRRAILRADK